MVFGEENAIEILIVNVLIRSEKTVFAHRALVRQNRNQSVVYDTFAYPRGPVACVSHHKSHCKALFQSFIQTVERNAVVNITRIDCYIENISILVAGSLSGVSKAFLMLAFVENSAFRIGFGFGYYFLFGWVSAVKRLLAVGFTVLIYLVQKLFAVDFGSLRHGSANDFFHAGTGFDVSSVNEHCFRRKIPRVVYLIEYPVEYLLHHFFCEPVAEIIAEC